MRAVPHVNFAKELPKLGSFRKRANEKKALQTKGASGSTTLSTLLEQSASATDPSSTSKSGTLISRRLTVPARRHARAAAAESNATSTSTPITPVITTAA